jgi:crotonobetainyl-CoA:carnitine CoA-transferase CaiB-like acyl-CoA transferase
MSESADDASPVGPGPTGALDGVRIIDLTTVLMGPLASRYLGDHGADVIRVEGPDVDSFSADSSGLSGIALDTHRNKRSIQLDLKSEAGMAAMWDLLGSADVLISNVRAAGLERLGLSADAVRARLPRLIHCVANGYGPDGPYADRPAYDDAIQASSGLAALRGRVDGVPGYVPSVIVDKVCALHIVQAVLAAVLHQRATGEGQTIQVSMFETMAAFNLIEHFRGAALDPPRGEVGYPRLLTPHRRPYRCADGWIALLPYTTSHWLAFFELIDRPDLAADQRFATHGSRIDHIDELYEAVAEAAPSRTVEEWMTDCGNRSIPASPVLDLADLVDDAHLEAVGLFERAEHPALGPYRTVRNPVVYDTLSVGLRRHAPTPGQHTDEVMGELGWGPERLADLGRPGLRPRPNPG